MVLLYFLVILNSIFSDNETFIFHAIEPPLPIVKNVYYCDKIFHTDQVEYLFETYDKHGIIIITGENTELYLVNGTNYELIDSLNIHRQKKQKKGGQSAHRFQMIQIEQVNQYVKRICEMITKNYTTNNIINIKSLIIAGYGDIKSFVIKELDNRFTSIITNNITTQNIDITNIINSNSDILFGIDIREQNIIFDKFNEIMNTNIDKIIYGHDMLLQYATNGQLKELLVHITQKDNDIINIATKYGCIINYVNIDKNNILNYGGIIGLTWY